MNNRGNNDGREAISRERAQELRRLARETGRDDYQAIAQELGEVVSQLERTGNGIRRAKPYPDDQLALALGGDGWRLGWQTREGGGYRWTRYIDLDRGEALWFAESAAQSSFGRSALLEQFGLIAVKRQRAILNTARSEIERSLEACNATIAKHEAELQSLEPPPMPEGTNETVVREGGPLPAERKLRCRYCEDDVPARCFVCRGTEHVFVRPAPAFS